MATLETIPALTRHINSLDQKFPTDGSSSNEPEAADHRLEETQSPPPLVDLVTVITPKQSKSSKKWSVGLNQAQNSLLFAYQGSARFAIQNDGRLFKTTSKQTLSAAHSFRPSSSMSIPRISHVSVPRQINFRNNAVVQMNHQWHLGELLPMTYTANLRPPDIPTICPKESIERPPDIVSSNLLIDEEPVFTDDEDESMNDDIDTGHLHLNQHPLADDDDHHHNNTMNTMNKTRTLSMRSTRSTRSRPTSTIHHPLSNIPPPSDTLIAPSKSYLTAWNECNFNDSSFNDLDQNRIAIRKIVHDHNHNHHFFWNHHYDHHSGIFDKLEHDVQNEESHLKFLHFLRQSEHDKSTFDLSTQLGMIKMDIVASEKEQCASSEKHSGNVSVTAMYKYMDPTTNSIQCLDDRFVHRPLCLAHGNNIVFLLFPDGNIWSAHHCHLLQPEPFQPSINNIKMLDPTFNVKLLNPTDDLEEDESHSDDDQKVNGRTPRMKTRRQRSRESDYVKKTLNKPFKTRPLVIGDWRIGEGEHRWFLIKYVPTLKRGNRSTHDMHSEMADRSKMDWELSEEDARSKLVFMISPAGRIWSRCGGGAWYNAGHSDDAFNQKWKSLGDRMYKLVTHPLPFCRAGLSLVPDATFIRPNIEQHDSVALAERAVIIRQLRCLAMPNEIVPMEMDQQYGDSLRGLYSNLLYDANGTPSHFVHYMCAYLWDSFKVKSEVYSDRTVVHSGFVPYVLCLVTSYPFHNSFARILDNFMAIKDKVVMSTDGFIESVHQILSRSFQAIKPLMSSCEDNEKWNVDEEVITIDCPNGDAVKFANDGRYAPLSGSTAISYYTPSLQPDVNWGVLFRYCSCCFPFLPFCIGMFLEFFLHFRVLEPLNVLAVITALLQETKVIILTEHPSLLFPCCEVLLSLMYPFQWIHFYRPFIPPSDPYINRYLTFSKPALFGIMSSSITKLPDDFRGMIVRLDSNEIEHHQHVVSTLPSKLRLWLFLMILQNADFYLHHRPDHACNDIRVPPGMQRHQIHAIRSPKFKKEAITNDVRFPSPPRLSPSPQSVPNTIGYRPPITAGPKRKSPSPNRHLGRMRSNSASSPRAARGSSVTQSFPVLNTTLSQSSTSSVTPIKWSALDTVQFDGHGFLGSRQEINYRKQPLVDIVLASKGAQKAEAEAVVRRLQLHFDLYFVHELFIPPHSTSKAYDVYMDTYYNINRTECKEQLTPRCIAQFFLTLVYRDELGVKDEVALQEKVDTFMDEMLPSIVDSAKIVTDNFAPMGFDVASLFNDHDTTAPLMQQDDNDNDAMEDIEEEPLEDLNERSTKNGALYGVRHYRPSVPPSNDELSSLILSQFLDRLLSTTIWTHLISHWHYRDSLNWFSIVHGDSNGSKGMATKEYFGCFDIALKSYLMDRKKLRVLRNEIMEKGKFEALGNNTMCKDTSYHQDKKRKSIVVVQNHSEKNDPIERCGFYNPWQIRWCRDTAESMEDLQNALRETQMIAVHVSWNYRIGAVIGYQQSTVLFESWLAIFVRRLEELAQDEHDDDDFDLHEYEHSNENDSDNLGDLAEEDSPEFERKRDIDEPPKTPQPFHNISGRKRKPKHGRNASAPSMLSSKNLTASLFQSKSVPFAADDTGSSGGRRSQQSKHKKSRKRKREGLQSTVGIQIFVRDLRSLKSVVETLRRRQRRNELGGVDPKRIWVSAHVLNATQPVAIAKELIIEPKDFFDAMDMIPDFTVCLSWCTRGGQVFTKQHMEEMKQIVDQFIFNKRSSKTKSTQSTIPGLGRNHTVDVGSSSGSRSRHSVTTNHGQLAGLKDANSLKSYLSSSNGRSGGGHKSSVMTTPNRLSGTSHHRRSGHGRGSTNHSVVNSNSRKRSFCFYVRASHLFVGDGWKYLHSILLDKYPSSCVVLTAHEERISITNFKWLSAHFPSNRSFYTFEKDDIQNDLQSLNVLHYMVESTRSPLWFGDLKQHRKPPALVPSKLDHLVGGDAMNGINGLHGVNGVDFATNMEDVGDGQEEDRITYHDGGVLPSGSMIENIFLSPNFVIFHLKKIKND